MADWDERFETGSYPLQPDPSPVLDRYVDAFPEGRALDVATGTGRNAVFLADHGYEVDALDRSRPGLERTREYAADRGVENRLNLVEADIDEYAFPEDAYDVITVSYFRAVDRFPDIKAALRDGGCLFVEHHLRTTDDVERGPSGDRYRYAANELLHACLDLTVLYFDAVTAAEDGRRGATTRLVARKSCGGKQVYPEVEAER